MADKQPQAFLSYAHADDDNLNGGITWLCERLKAAMRVRTDEPFELYQDLEAVFIRKDWPDQIEKVQNTPCFQIPILTPSFFSDIKCREQTLFFLDLEKMISRRDLIFPIYFVNANTLEDPKLRARDQLATQLYQHRYFDWREMRLELMEQIPSAKISELADAIMRAAKQSADAPPDIPEQGLGARFRINEDGLIDRAPDEPHDPG